MNLIDQIKENAKKAQKTIVLPEAEEERTLKAANIILQEGYAQLVLLGNQAKIEKQAAEWGLKRFKKQESLILLIILKKSFTLRCYVKSVKAKNADG